MSWYTLYPMMPASAWVAEAPAPWQSTIPEKLVRCLWFDRRWRPSPLRTLDRREVIVHSPGRWNLQAGPDFQQASIAFADGIRQRGDVEIHRYASGWTAPRHGGESSCDKGGSASSTVCACTCCARDVAGSTAAATASMIVCSRVDRVRAYTPRVNSG